MTFKNVSSSDIAALLRSARNVAVVGLSDNPMRDSYDVASALRHYGYRIIPVNPTLQTWDGVPAFPTLDTAVEGLEPRERIDIVNVFRQSRYVADIVDQCLRLKLPALWLQLGVVDEKAALRAQAAGMTVVMDKCIKVERMRI